MHVRDTKYGMNVSNKKIMLRNAKFTTFTVSELLRRKLTEARGESIPC